MAVGWLGVLLTKVTEIAPAESDGGAACGLYDHTIDSDGTVSGCYCQWIDDPSMYLFFKKKKKTVSRTLPVRESIQFIGESYCGRGIPEREGFRRLVCLIFSSFNLPTRDHVGCSTTDSHFSPLFPDVYLK